jgi:hypothetical protein
MKKFLILLLAVAAHGNPLICQNPVVFSETVSVQVDHVPVGSTVYLERLVPGEFADIWVEVTHVDKTTDPQVVFIIPKPLDIQQTYRAYYQQ